MNETMFCIFGECINEMTQIFWILGICIVSFIIFLLLALKFAREEAERFKE